eukprot:4331145-Pleurochrysis_carterae.AAC.1
MGSHRERERNPHVRLHTSRWSRNVPSARLYCNVARRDTVTVHLRAETALSMLDDLQGFQMRNESYARKRKWA